MMIGFYHIILGFLRCIFFAYLFSPGVIDNTTMPKMTLQNYGKFQYAGWVCYICMWECLRSRYYSCTAIKLLYRIIGL